MPITIDKLLGEPLLHNHSANDISSVTDRNFVTDAQLSILNNTSGTNTGDQDLSGYQATSLKGVSNGYASLDSAGKVPIGQLPSSIMSYQGTWDASTNTPTLADGVSNSDDDIGNVYRVTVAGSQDLGSGSISFSIGDYVILNASKVWEKSDTTDSVASVFGRTGVVTAQTNDYTWSQIDKTTSSINDITTKTHNLLTGLDSDDHTQYVLLAGRSGGQTIYGGTASSNNLTLDSTSNATKGDLLLQPSGGNVGIGTTASGAKLLIDSSLDSFPSLQTKTKQGQRVFSYLKEDGTNLWYGQYDTSNFHTYLNDRSLWFNMNGNSVRFDGGGNSLSSVSISGSAKFVLNSPPEGGVNLIAINDGGYATASSQLTTVRAMKIGTWAWNGTNGYSIGSRVYLNQTQLSATNNDARFDIADTNNVSLLSILTSSGNVGIGTTNPDYKLDVNGTFRANTTTPVFGANTLTVPATGTAALLETAQTFTGVNTFNDNIISNSAIAVGLSSPLMPLHLQTDGSGGASVAAFDFDNGFVSRIFELRTGSSGSSIGWDTNSFFSFGTIAAHNQSGLTSTYMRIDNTGNVGIGTTSPTAKLQVSGNLALVDGMSEPSTITGYASIYVDSADGDLKVKFGDGTVKTISTDT